MVLQEMPDDLRGKASASDLVQDTFLERIATFISFRERRRASWALVERLLRNNFANFLRDYRDRAKRRASREVPLSSEGRAVRYDRVLVAPTPSPGSDLIRKESREMVREAVRHLPGPYREVLRLRYVERLSFREIGTHIGQSAESVRNCAFVRSTVWASSSSPDRTDDSASAFPHSGA
jgi:RNA polymerase sigma factor (sigma-70 family)